MNYMYLYMLNIHSAAGLHQRNALAYLRERAHHCVQAVLGSPPQQIPLFTLPFRVALTKAVKRL